MGPPLDGGGDLPTIGSPSPSGICFNGAAARWRRRHVPRPRHRGRLRQASMGPPLDGGGDSPNPAHLDVRLRLLQWGRRSMAAETSGCGRASRSGSWASMGPPLDGGGDSAWLMTSSDSHRLQWGRRSMAAETSAPPRRPAPAGRCFNGAAARWRRRPRAVGVQRERRPRASMGPPLDGGGDVRRPRHVHVVRSASMGPPLDGGGDRSAGATRPAAPPGFNGAAARWRRRLVRRAADLVGVGASMGPPLDGGGDRLFSISPSASSAWLQWGRRSMAAETPAPCPRRWRRGGASMGPPLDGGGDGERQRGGRQRAGASMGPPLDGGGDAAAVVGAPADRGGFNGAAARWRRRRPTTRTKRGWRVGFNGAAARWRRRLAHGCRASAAHHLLQWGRRSMAAETGASDHSYPHRLVASMGPPLDGGGDVRHRVVPFVAHGASMGPPLDGGGDRSRRAGDRDLTSTLQWGRRSMAAETRALGDD